MSEIKRTPAEQALIRCGTELQQETKGQGAPWLRELRASGLETFRRLGLPTTRDEEWKYTSLAGIAETSFVRAPADAWSGAKGATRDRVEAAVARVGLDGGQRLVFVDGRFAADLSSVGGLPRGVEVASLQRALAGKDQRLGRVLGKPSGGAQRPAWVALNAAMVSDGAYVVIPAGVAVEEAIELVFISTARDELAVATHPRIVIVAERASQARVVECYLGEDGTRYLTNSVTQVMVGEGAHLDHYKLQQEGSGASHISTVEVEQARDSGFHSSAFQLGGALVRNDFNVLLGAEGVSSTLNGLFLAGDAQHMDTHTAIDHAHPHGTSHELYKGVLDGQATGVFNGKVFVRPQAQKTDAKQANKNLLLSDEATINSKPQLEIWADDVKCTHGATTGHLDKDALFYLRSRAIGEELARKLLVYAFACEVIEEVKVEPLRAWLGAAVRSRLGVADDGAELASELA